MNKFYHSHLEKLKVFLFTTCPNLIKSVEYFTLLFSIDWEVNWPLWRQLTSRTVSDVQSRPTLPETSRSWPSPLKEISGPPLLLAVSLMVYRCFIGNTYGESQFKPQVFCVFCEFRGLFIWLYLCVSSRCTLPGVSIWHFGSSL